MKDEREMGLAFVIWLVLVVGGIFFGAFVGMTLFNWFVSPIINFRVSYWHMLGLNLFIDYALLGVELALANKPNKEADNYISVNLAVPVANYIMLLAMWGIGALVVLGV